MNKNTSIYKDTITMPITMEEAGSLIKKEMNNNNGKISAELVDAFLRATLPVGTPDIMIKLTPEVEDVITIGQMNHLKSIIDEYGTQDNRIFKLIKYIYEQGYAIRFSWREVCCTVTIYLEEEENNE